MIRSGIDIVVPCYRYAHFLEECVNSCLGQSYADLRVIIIDDASPDDTPAVAARLARADPRVIYVRHVRNLGHIATYNDGIDRAAADYFLLLSADDHLLPGALERAIGLMEANPGMSLVFGGCLGGESGMGWAGWTPQGGPGASTVLSGREFIRLSGPRNVVATPTAVVRTTILREVGGYRPELPHAGDMEMWFRLAAHGDIGVIHADQAIYRRHRHNMSEAYGLLHDIEQRHIALQSFFASSLHRFPDGPALRARLLRQLAVEAISLAHLAFNRGDPGQCTKLLEFARAIDGQADRSPAGLRLRIKRLVGTARWLQLAGMLGRRNPVGDLS